MESIKETFKKYRVQKPDPYDFKGLPRRPQKRNKRIYLDYEYFDLGYSALLPNTVTLIYLTLLRFINYDTQTTFVSYERIMKITNIKNRNTIASAIKILASFDVIVVLKSAGRRSNTYVFIDPTKWRKIDSIKIDTTTRKSIKKFLK